MTGRTHKERQMWEKNCLKGKEFSICEKNVDLSDHNYLKLLNKILYLRRHMDCNLLTLWRLERMVFPKSHVVGGAEGTI